MRKCESCGKDIFFKQNTKGKWVCYTYSTNKPHVYACNRSSELRDQFVKQKIALNSGYRRNVGD